MLFVVQLWRCLLGVGVSVGNILEGGYDLGLFNMDATENIFFVALEQDLLFWVLRN